MKKQSKEGQVISNKTVLLIIIFVAIFLRLYKINEYLNFGSDVSWYYLQALETISNLNIPLVGIPTSVPVFKQGAIFTWILSFILWVGNYNPISGAIFTISLGVIAVLTTHKVVKRYFDIKTSLIATSIVATSSLIVYVDRLPYIISPVYLLTIMTFYLISEYLDKGGKYLLYLGIVLGIAYQFELANFVLYPISIIIILIYKKHKTLKDIKNYFLGTVIGVLPFLIHDVKSGVYIQTLGFMGWVISKTIENLNNLIFLDQTSLNTKNLSDYAGKLLFPNSSFLSLFLIISSVLFVVIIAFKKNNKYLQYSCIWFLIAFTALIIKGDLSLAYLPALLFPLLIIVSYFSRQFLLKNYLLILIFVILLFMSNYNYLINNKFSIFKTRPITVKERSAAVNAIINDSKSNNIRINYVGPLDYYSHMEAPYEYLLKIKGVNISYLNKKEYIIIEPGELIRLNFNRVIYDNNVKVVLIEHD